MDTYNPSKPLVPQTWLALDEATQITLVQSYHESIEHELTDEALSVHCSLHVIVENQLAMEVEYIPETIAKLTRQGLERHEAIHAIGAIILDDVFAIARGDTQEFSPSKNRKKLAKITAKRWLKGQY